MRVRARALVVVGMALVPVPTPGSAQVVPSPVASHIQGAPPAAAMKDHFGKALAVHTIIVRGDVAALGPAAREWLAEIDRTPWPANAAAPVDAMRRAAREVASATQLGTAASAMGRVLAECGTCHRATGVMPATPLAPLHHVGGIVGHMLDHQRALTHLLEGLVVPSASVWRHGAESLQVAPLQDNRLPPDRDEIAALKALERQVHDLGGRAAAADTAETRAEIYGELVGSCARCHALHVKVWGPTAR